jgi:mRNA interferase RelE/StbE
VTTSWSIELEPQVRKDLRGLGVVERRRVLSFLHERLPSLPDPRAVGAALTGPLAGLWKYRVGDIRIVARIRHNELLILVVAVGNRADVYR